MIDLMTWLLLVPMLMETDDSVKREYWRSIMFCTTSYMVGGEAAVGGLHPRRGAEPRCCREASGRRAFPRPVPSPLY